MNTHRWDQWLWTCVFALLPLLVWLVLVQVIGVEGDAGFVEASRELLFTAENRMPSIFDVIITAASLGLIVSAVLAVRVTFIDGTNSRRKKDSDTGRHAV